MQDELRRVRFNTARVSRNGAFYEGIDYDLPAAFAAQLVESEHVAHYVDDVQAAPPAPSGRRRPVVTK